MNIENLKQEWQKSADKSIASIENYLSPRKDTYPEDVNFGVLANWLIENSYSTYDYMPNHYQNFRATPFATESLLATLHHALCDDGDVSFVKMMMEGEVKRVFMVFVWKNEDCFNSICQKENESLMNSFIKGRESHERVMQQMQEKYPEKSFKSKPLISQNEFVFEAHSDPLLFIKEVEEFQLQQQKTREDNAVWENKIRTNKPR